MSEDTTKLIDEELKEWQDSLDYVIQKDGIERAKKISRCTLNIVTCSS